MSNCFYFKYSCFNIQVSALNTVEAKKRFEFLEAVAGIMDAHLRYFQQVYELAIYSNTQLVLIRSIIAVTLLLETVYDAGLSAVASDGTLHPRGFSTSFFYWVFLKP